MALRPGREIQRFVFVLFCRKQSRLFSTSKRKLKTRKIHPTLLIDTPHQSSSESPRANSHFSPRHTHPWALSVTSTTSSSGPCRLWADPRAAPRSSSAARAYTAASARSGCTRASHASSSRYAMTWTASPGWRRRRRSPGRCACARRRRCLRTRSARVSPPAHSVAGLSPQT